MPQTVGVVAIQGDFARHIAALHRLDPALIAHEARTPEDLEGCERLILPGGESTTVGLLMQRFGLAEAIQRKAAEGMPIWGTCMGMIMLATEVEGRDQFRLGLLDVTVRRNAFGAQVNSFEDEVRIKGIDHPVMGVFIRAPIVTRVGPKVEVLATYDDKIVAVREGTVLGTSFHPELTDDTSLHESFLGL